MISAPSAPPATPSPVKAPENMFAIACGIVAEIHQDYNDGEQTIKDRHKGNDFFRHFCDRFDPADDYHEYYYRHDQSN